MAPMEPWKQHFLASTRGRILLLLRRSSRTVDDLARELHLTDNAVRVHLLTLEREGLICQAGARRGGGKPALLYATTPGVEQLFGMPRHRSYEHCWRCFSMECLSSNE